MNNLDDINYLHQLYDIYGNLLTNKQQNYFELYYFEDLSLAEIASNLSISRSAVHNNLQATVNHLHYYELELKILTKRIQLDDYLIFLNKKKIITREDLSKIKDFM